MYIRTSQFPTIFPYIYIPLSLIHFTKIFPLFPITLSLHFSLSCSSIPVPPSSSILILKSLPPIIIISSNSFYDLLQPFSYIFFSPCSPYTDMILIPFSLSVISVLIISSFFSFINFSLFIPNPFLLPIMKPPLALSLSYSFFLRNNPTHFGSLSHSLSTTQVSHNLMKSKFPTYLQKIHILIF